MARTNGRFECDICETIYNLCATELEIDSNSRLCQECVDAGRKFAFAWEDALLVRYKELGADVARSQAVNIVY